jgi:dolichol-phosphate mannosyltransferase
MSSCTVILPALNEENVIEKAVAAIFSAFERVNLDIVIVDDGSTDGTWEKIKKISKDNPLVKGIRFTRNFGKEGAIMAGLHEAAGDCVIVMDSDLQFPPKTAVEMFELWHTDGYMVVEGVKIRRQKESFIYKLGASAFYKFLRRFAGLDMNNTSDFKLLDREVVELLKKMPERQSFFRAITGWTGVRSAKIYFTVQPRIGGATKWSYFRLMKFAVSSITSFTTLPMQLVTFTGFGFMLFALIMSVQTLWMKASGKAVAGFTTVIVLLLIVGSILMISLGVIGVYIAKIYDEIKFRPRYIVSEISWDDGRKSKGIKPDKDFMDILAGRKSHRE